MSYSLHSLKVGYIGDHMGSTIGLMKGDSRSLDYSSYDIAFSALDICQRSSYAYAEPFLLPLGDMAVSACVYGGFPKLGVLLWGSQ